MELFLVVNENTQNVKSGARALISYLKREREVEDN